MSPRLVGPRTHSASNRKRASGHGPSTNQGDPAIQVGGGVRAKQHASGNHSAAWGLPNFLSSLSSSTNSSLTEPEGYD